MKTNLILACLLYPVCHVAMSQVTKKTLELPEFKSIYVNSNYTVYVKQTNKQEVTVEALTEIYELTSIHVDNGILMIDIDRKPEDPDKTIWEKIDDIKLNPTMKVMVSLKNINDLQVNGGGRIISENSLSSNYLNLSVTGNGNMEIDVKGDVIKAEVSGSGKLGLKGYATSIDILVSGSGSVNGFNCNTETAKVKVSGPGSAEINVSESLDARVLGSGVVKHKGNTRTVNKKVYGSGLIERAY